MTAPMALRAPYIRYDGQPTWLRAYQDADRQATSVTGAQLHPEWAGSKQDISLMLVSAMAVILALSEMMTSGAGTTSVSAITGRLLGVAIDAAGFTDDMLRRLGARGLDRRDVELLFPALPLLCERAGLATPPEVYVIPGASPNAFALGDASRSAILVTEGSLASFTAEEMTAVLAHELGHILSGDAYLLAFAAELNRRVAAAAIAAQQESMFALRGGPAQRCDALIQLWSLVAPNLSYLLQCAVSRAREFDADGTAAALLGQPYWLIDALKKLSRDTTMADQASVSSAPRSFTMLLNTHPDPHQRARRLAAFAHAYHRVPA